MVRSVDPAIVHGRQLNLPRETVYGPVRTVVWQGSEGDRRPYADLVAQRLPITDPSSFHSDG
jgi:hypothetical protein